MFKCSECGNIVLLLYDNKCCNCVTIPKNILKSMGMIMSLIQNKYIDGNKLVKNKSYTIKDAVKLSKGS